MSSRSDMRILGAMLLWSVLVSGGVSHAEQTSILTKEKLNALFEICNRLWPTEKTTQCIQDLNEWLFS